MESLRVTYVGGPTALLEWRGVRLLTDPTFDAADTAAHSSGLRKTQGPALDAGSIGRVDAVLLSHDHHRDNLDDAGRALLPRAERVLTTTDGGARLGGNAVGLAAWDEAEVGSVTVTVTATPARHGPAGGDRGPVIGFVLDDVVYVSGDTVWFEGVAEVAERFDPRVAVLNLGAARVAAAGPHALTLTAADALEVARAMPRAAIVPLHFEGWEHFSESRADVERAFRHAGLEERLRWPPPGEPIAVP